MFGLNDNDNQTQSTNGGVPAADTAAPAHNNPIGAPPPDTAPASVPMPASAPAAFTVPPLPSEPGPSPAVSADPPAGDDLLDLKQQALHSLQPLVSHLDQSPEEKFKTTMMLIQATDNSELVKEAYETANKISDEKTRAQALLDVVNEINYFTHKDK